MASIFTKIVRGEIPCYKIAESSEFLAFFDINPVAKGHTLVIPKVEIDYFFDLDDEMLGKMMKFSKTVAKALKSTFPCNRIGITVIGLDVPHAHVHLIPISSMSDMDFKKVPLKFSKEEFLQMAEAVQSNY